MAKTTAPFTTPVLDLPGLFASHQKNVEALTAATQLLFAGAQTFFQRQAEIAKAAFDSSVAVAPTLLQPPSTEQFGGHLAVAKGLLDTVVAGTRELSGLVVQTGSEAATLLTGRVSAGLAEAQAAVVKQAA